MATSIPTLGSNGWESSPEGTADYIIACFLATNTSQTVLHREQNTSLQYLLKLYANDMLGLEQALRDTLTRKLQAVFGNSAEANVDVTPDENNPDRFSIRFLGVIREGAREYTVGRLVQFQNSRVINIATINNG